MRKLIIILLINIFIFKLYAQNKSEKMKVCFEDFRPSAYFENKKAVGIDVEILESAMGSQNVAIEFIMMPWNRCLSELDSNKIDAVIPMVFSEERNLKYSLGSSMRTRGNFFIVNKNFKKKIKTISDLEGLVVLIGKGYSISKDFNDAKNFEKIEVTSSEFVYAKILNMIATNRADIGVIDLQIYPWLVKDLNLESKLVRSDLILTKETHVGFTKNNKFLEIYEKGYKNIKKQGLIEIIIKKYEYQIK